MKRKITFTHLLFPLCLAFCLLLPLLGTAAIGEHRYEKNHPHYLQNAVRTLLGEEDTPRQDMPTEKTPEATVMPVQKDAAEPSSTTVLVLGRDAVAGLTDVIFLATVNKDDHTLHLLQLPRDTYAAYTTAGYRKLNGAYRRLGGEGMTAFLTENMGIPVDHYVCIELAALGKIVDCIGGVRMTVQADMDYDDPSQDLHIHLKAGEQRLNGDAAQAFVRYRSGYAMADVGRLDAQKLFLSALARETQESLTLPEIISLAGTVFQNVKTDMSLFACISLAEELRQVDLNAMQMATVPGHSARLDGGKGACYYIINRAETEQLLQETVEGAGSFDPNIVFCREDKPAVSAIYYGEAGKYTSRSYSAADALGGALTVRRRNG